MKWNGETKRIEAMINSAVAELDLPSDLFYKCDEFTAENVVREAKTRFVEGTPGVWWFTLKHIVFRQHFPDGGSRHLLKYVPRQEETCWFIPGPREKKHTLVEEYSLVYSARVSCLFDIIGNCYGFDYYLVGKDFDWLLAETDEDELILSVLQSDTPGSDG